ncbi:aspartate kinase [Alienimonas californiensis]|uniref:aspartate kinase n=1 Tax=Alienimonas californiensis TaxID=2527989 RepID=A0A517P8I7_9PLAN|nr:aspartate kinase [Alienimonas californiensis]QDT15675.1 Aspartokinase [Alienimonas californiensis]
MPRIIVQKFGGTSVGDTSRIRRAAARAVAAQQEGAQVVMVVSARGKKTDELVSLAGEFDIEPPAREMDMLLATGEQESVALMAMALREAGAEAVSLTGGQIGISTDDTYGKARIRAIKTDRLREHLDAGRIVVAAGFQGVSDSGDITTLGRGGSDLTAAALAAVLGAERCEIYTDVPGVFTVDPRIEPAARKLSRIGYDEMLELASLGAGVMHSRSIEFAGKYGVPIEVRSSLSDEPGTLIARAGAPARPVTGLALVRDAARVTLAGLPDRPGVMAEIFRRMADRAIPLDMVVQDLSVQGIAEVSFTVPQEDLAGALAAAKAAVDALDGAEVTVGTDLAKISAVGAGMPDRPGVAAKMFRTLADIGCNVELVTTSEIKVSCLIARDRANEAIRAVHAAFELDQAADADAAHRDDHPLSPQEQRVRTVVEGLQGMEDIVVADVSLDAHQARLSVRPVPDRPGVLADLFEAVAGGPEDDPSTGATVDMIVQNVSHAGHAAISFTVPESEANYAAELAAAPAVRWGEGAVQIDPHVAKLSVTGVGLRSHTGVGLKLFAALAEAKVNVQLIGTSEMRVSVVVAANEGERAVEAVRGAFGIG